MKYAKKLIISLILILFISLTLILFQNPYYDYIQGSSYDSSCEIISPTSAIPTIIKKGNTLNIVFETKQTATDFKVILLTEYFERPLSITSTKFKNNNWQINATIPMDTPIELYNLKVTCSECADINQRSVKVIEDYKSTFSFVHISDTHIGAKESEKILSKILEELNLINPEFVLLTGDITHSCENVGRALMLREGKKVSTIDLVKYLGDYKKMSEAEIKQICINEYTTLLKLLSNLKVPTYIVPGNHEMVGLYNPPCKQLYEQMISKRRYYSFDYGDYHFIGCDNSLMMEASASLYPDFKDELEKEQLLFIENDLKNNQDKKLRIAFFHFPVHHRKECKLKELLQKYNVNVALAGHWHFDMVEEKGKPIWIITTSTVSPASVFGPQHRGYRLIKITEGKITSHSYYDEYSIPYNELTYWFTKPNEGKHYEISCKIVNNLEQEFNNALIRFVMPKDANYEVINGRLFQEVTTKKFKLIYVNVNIPQEKEIEVTVRRIKKK